MDYLNPKHINDLLHYKIGYKLYFLLQKRDHPHLVLYGLSNSGKSTLIKAVMGDLYPGQLLKQNDEKFSHALHNNYYLFNCSSINDKIEFNKYIQRIIKTYDYYNDNSKYIILDNFEKMTQSMQNIFKVILEKSYVTCKFIILTNQYNNTSPAIKSRCASIRVPLPNKYDKFLYLQKRFIQKNILFNNFHLIEECKDTPLHTLLFNYLFYNSFNIKENEYKKLIFYITKKELTEKDFLQIKRLSSVIKEVDIPFETMIEQYIFSLKEKDKYIEIIKVCNDYNYWNIKSYRELVHIESLIIQLNMITNDINI